MEAGKRYLSRLIPLIIVLVFSLFMNIRLWKNNNAALLECNTECNKNMDSLISIKVNLEKELNSTNNELNLTANKLNSKTDELNRNKIVSKKLDSIVREVNRKIKLYLLP